MHGGMRLTARWLIAWAGDRSWVQKVGGGEIKIGYIGPLVGTLNRSYSRSTGVVVCCLKRGSRVGRKLFPRNWRCTLASTHQ